MELDDFRKRKNATLSDIDSKNRDPDKKADEIIAVFKAYEQKKRRLSIGIIVINFSLGVIYFSNVSHKTGMVQLGFFIGGIGFIIAAIYLYMRYRPLSPANYTLSIQEFLSRAEKRLRFFSPVDYAIIPLILGIIGTGGGLVFTGSLHKYTDNVKLLAIIWVIFFILLVIFGFWASKKNWKRDNGFLYNKIIEMKDS